MFFFRFSSRRDSKVIYSHATRLAVLKRQHVSTRRGLYTDSANPTGAAFNRPNPGQRKELVLDGLVSMTVDPQVNASEDHFVTIFSEHLTV